MPYVMNNHAVLQCQHLTKYYADGDLKTHVLSDINLTVNRGDRLAIVGSSGSG